jgi:protein-S-isoprenylcysteine O-methyltransferase Ste14
MSESGQDDAGIKVRPPFIYLAFLLAGFGINYAWPAALFPESLRYGIGGLLIGLGLILAASAFAQFRRAKTPFRLNRPTTAIVTSGPFRYTRNPLYLALTLVYAGIACIGNSGWSLILLVPVLLIIRYAVIAREERYLERKFGDEYLRYKASVRRWV